MIKKTTIIGDYNRSSIVSGSNSLAISVVHNQGDELVITGFQITYGANQEKVLARIYDAQKNRDITSPTTQIQTIGVSSSDSPPIAPWIKIEPIILRSGQSIQLYINNVTGSSIAAGDIALTLYGYQVEK